MPVRPSIGTIASVLILLSVPAKISAQRANENAIASSDDAFGTAVGLESTGIYTDSDTRGFSPLKAGNARIDGVYYDPIGGQLSGRIKASTAIRVGFAAADYPFHAPTGIVDFRFRTFPKAYGLSLGLNRTGYNGLVGEVDVRLPIIKDHLSLTGGAASAVQHFTDGTSSLSRGIAIRPMFRFGGVEFNPFWTIARFREVRNHTLVVVADGYLPKFPKKRLYLGQKWAGSAYYSSPMGMTLKAPLTDNLSMRGGLFHVNGDRDAFFSEIYAVTAPSGLANHIVISDPKQDIHTTSGELQLALRLGSGRVQHRIIAGFRARDRVTESGGSDIRNFGRVIYGTPDRQLEPHFVYTKPNRGELRQSSLMLGYLGRIDGVGLINLGVQKARYRARSRDGRTGLVTAQRDDPLLYNASIEVDLSHAISAYAGTERGLEDSGTAPDNAANRNEQLPATRSTQYEGGVRWKFTGGQLVLNAFQIEKPYFSFNAANAFTEVGNVRHRGIETSLSGHFGKRLSIIAGAVAIKAQVSGPARDLGLVGNKPAGVPSLYGRFDLNYRTDIFGGLTPTMAVVYTGKRAVGSRPLPLLGGRQLSLPGFASLDLGLRQQFMLGNLPSNMRFVIFNVFNTSSWKVVAANTLFVDETRRFSLSLTSDF